jgi:SAM-dependent methyltransferase
MTPMTCPPSSCHVCGATRLTPLPAYAAMPRVSSDCRPVAVGGALWVCEACGTAQKPATPEFLADIGAIYAAYDVYYQGGGAEQIVFDAEAGEGVRRSALLSGRIAATGLLPASGSVIDIGCGNGAFLRALGQRLPEWDLYGLELDDRNLAVMRDIPRFAGLRIADATKLEGTYALITMIHALEHFTDPFAALVALRGNLGQDGILFIEVPNVAENPFDLTIADHATHFTPATLESLLIRAGLEPLRFETGWVKKELSVLARPARGPVEPRQKADPPGLVAAQLAWLDATLAATREAAARGGTFGMFGTSIAATWLAGALAERIAFHVDEDTSRQGRDFFGKPVLAPESVPAGAVVFLAVAPAVAEAIAPRLRRLGLDPVLPPPLAA